MRGPPVSPSLAIFCLLCLPFAAALQHSSPKPELTAHSSQLTARTARPLLLALKQPGPRTAKESDKLPALDQKAAIVLIVAIAVALSGGSVSLLAFAALKTRAPVPHRSLAASVLVALGSAAVERVGHHQRLRFNGRVLSEVGQAVVVGSVGWACFSAAWALGFGSVLTPGLQPPLNAAAVFGCSAAALGYAQLRAPSPAHVAMPMLSAIVMAHLHVLLHDGALPPGVLPTMQLASGAIAAVALALHGCVIQAHKPPRAGAPTPPTMVLQGTREVVVLACLVHLMWSSATLSTWSCSKCPDWGLAAAAASLHANEVLLHVLMRADPLFDGIAASYKWQGRWLASLAAFRALSALVEVGKDLKVFERHYYSLVGTFGLWSASSAALGRQWSAALGGGMLLVVVGHVLVGSLYGEPLVLVGALGLACGLLLLGLVLRFGSDQDGPTGPP